MSSLVYGASGNRISNLAIFPRLFFAGTFFGNLAHAVTVPQSTLVHEPRSAEHRLKNSSGLLGAGNGRYKVASFTSEKQSLSSLAEATESVFLALSTQQVAMDIELETLLNDNFLDLCIRS
ncbi:hypothetical protein RBI14_22365 [Alcaligenaceae bacterium B3P038]|nr:hypothetical protein [Alcaligenaceae bacterium B3P038]